MSEETGEWEILNSSFLYLTETTLEAWDSEVRDSLECKQFALKYFATVILPKRNTLVDMCLNWESKTVSEKLRSPSKQHSAWSKHLITAIEMPDFSVLTQTGNETHLQRKCIVVGSLDCMHVVACSGAQIGGCDGKSVARKWRRLRDKWTSAVLKMFLFKRTFFSLPIFWAPWTAYV